MVSQYKPDLKWIWLLGTSSSGIYCEVETYNFLATLFVFSEMYCSWRYTKAVLSTCVN